VYSPQAALTVWARKKGIGEVQARATTCEERGIAAGEGVQRLGPLKQNSHIADSEISCAHELDQAATSDGARARSPTIKIPGAGQGRHSPRAFDLSVVLPNRQRVSLPTCSRISTLRPSEGTDREQHIHLANFIFPGAEAPPPGGGVDLLNRRDPWTGIDPLAPA